MPPPRRRWTPTLTRFLPPLVLVALLAFVVLRACEQPSREAARARIERQSDAATDKARQDLSAEVDRYLAKFKADDDRLFAARAQLRARYVEKAVRARFDDLDKPVGSAEAREFAREALEIIAWEDVARTRPSTQFQFCLLALVEGGDAAAEVSLLAWLQQGSLGDLYALIRRGGGVQERRVREALARGCRERATRERAAGRAEEADDWALIGAILAVRREEYPEREGDVDLLLRTLDGRFRAEFLPRWTMGMIALGMSAHPRAIARLREHADTLAQGGSDADLRDLALVSMALMAADDWERAEIVPARHPGGPVGSRQRARARGADRPVGWPGGRGRRTARPARPRPPLRGEAAHRTPDGREDPGGPGSARLPGSAHGRRAGLPHEDGRRLRAGGDAPAPGGGQRAARRGPDRGGLRGRQRQASGHGRGERAPRPVPLRLIPARAPRGSAPRAATCRHREP
jgi:hypothetical protein